MSKELEAFLEYITVIRGLSQKTIQAYGSDLSDIEKNFPSGLISMNSGDIITLLSPLPNKRTLNRKLSAINSFLEFCHKSQFDSNLSKLSLSKVPKTLPHYLTYNDIMNSIALIDRNTWIGQRDYALILFLYATGTRISECLSVRDEDIDGEWLRIRHGKGEKERYIPIASEALEALREYQKNHPFKGSIVWKNYRGTPLSRISAFKITQQYLNTSPHTLRHSYATGLILGGADLRVVQELLGHTSLLTTQIYTHIQKHNLQDTVMNCHPMSKELI